LQIQIKIDKILEKLLQESEMTRMSRKMTISITIEDDAGGIIVEKRCPHIVGTSQKNNE
jgi:hypothetical protein